LVLAVRVATLADVPRMREIRGAVRENVLRDPSRVTLQDCRDHLGRSGQTWVYEDAGVILGFSAATLATAKIWALFVDPKHERLGIGRQLLDRAVAWLGEQGATQVSLTTWPGTRAERIYRAAGWMAGASLIDGEVVFTLHLSHRSVSITAEFSPPAPA
jgi:GNAT superfamily N-acetyltransferase